MPGQAKQGRSASDKLAAMFLGLANEEDDGELVLMIEPITLGGGKTLFPNDGQAREFDLTSAKTARTRRTGLPRPATGSQLSEDPDGRHVDSRSP